MGVVRLLDREMASLPGLKFSSVNFRSLVLLQSLDTKIPDENRSYDAP